jgi:capsular polysaccharide biosynthesis protein
VYPELYDLPTQAAMFRGARVVAGFGGSGMFNVLHCDQLNAMIVLSQERYTARNELLFAAALGADIHYFWSTPDLGRPSEGGKATPYYADWDFDFARNKADLDSLLRSI